MEVSPNADTVEVEYETTHGNQSRISGDVAEVHTKEAMFGDGEKVQAIDIEDAYDMAQSLREDADVLEHAAGKVEDGDWVSEEAAIYIARNSNYGQYDVAQWLDQEMPITEEP